MGRKTAETTHNINSAFGPGTANKCSAVVVQEVLQGGESLEDEEHTAWSSKVDNDYWEDYQSWSSYNYTRSCWNTQHQPFYSHWAFGTNWKDEKLHKWVPHELTKRFKKNHHFEVSSHSMKQQTISRSDFDTHWWADFIQPPTMTSSVAGLRRSPTEVSKTKLAPKKWSWSLFGGLLPIWSTIAFWILVNYYIWEVCSASRDAL